ncbi:MAG TPA: FecR domain-containing protein [Planctomycetota bacterium]|nr:FecR domain-containing protein [Planctomycetota bacterium]
MPCEKTDKELFECAFGLLDPELERHVEGCAKCGSRLGDMRRAVEGLHAWDLSEQARATAQRVVQATLPALSLASRNGSHSPSAATPSRRSLRPLIAAGACAVAVVAALIGLWSVGQTEGPVEAPTVADFKTIQGDLAQLPGAPTLEAGAAGVTLVNSSGDRAVFSPRARFAIQDSRTIALSGGDLECDIVTPAISPFRVQVPEGSIQVTGTRFVVSASTRSEWAVALAVLEGTVVFSGKSGRSAQIAAGQFLFVPPVGDWKHSKVLDVFPETETPREGQGQSFGRGQGTGQGQGQPFGRRQGQPRHDPAWHEEDPDCEICRERRATPPPARPPEPGVKPPASAPADRWGNLREAFRHALEYVQKEDLPPHYRELVEEYFRKLSEKKE